MSKKSITDKLNIVKSRTGDLTASGELKQSSKEKPSSERGVADGYMRFSFIAKKEYVEMLKALVWYERKYETNKDAMQEAMERLFSDKDMKKILAEYRNK